MYMLVLPGMVITITSSMSMMTTTTTTTITLSDNMAKSGNILNIYCSRNFLKRLVEMYQF